MLYHLIDLQLGATGSSTRAVAVGRDAANNTIEFVEFASTGNAQDFADATANRAGSPAAMSNGTRGVFAGGYSGPSITNLVEYITIASEGVNAQDFGDLTVSRSEPWEQAQSKTRGVIGSGRSSPNFVNTIDFITLQH